MDTPETPTDCAGDSILIDGKTLQAHFQSLLVYDIPDSLPPEERLLLGILRQAVADYFGDDPLMQLDAALYFAHGPLYRLTLRLFHLPETLLPVGVDLRDFRREKQMNSRPLDRLELETLVRDLSGTQLKIILTMGLVTLPATTRTISLRGGLTRSTVLNTLSQLAELGLVERQGEMRARWTLPAAVRGVVEEVWGSGSRDFS